MTELGILPSADTGGFLALGGTPRGKLFAKHLLTIGQTFAHPKTGAPITIDEAAWESLKRNFDAGVSHVTVPLANEKNEHDERPERNTGTVVDLRREGNKVIGYLDIRKPEIADQIANGLISGVSAMLHLNYADQNGKKVGPALLHACLTSRPFLTDLHRSRKSPRSPGPGTRNGQTVPPPPPSWSCWPTRPAPSPWPS
jgi:hypothetical protein